MQAIAVSDTLNINSEPLIVIFCQNGITKPSFIRIEAISFYLNTTGVQNSTPLGSLLILVTDTKIQYRDNNLLEKA